MLETERLVLRPWCMADAEKLFRLASDPLVGPAAGWAPHANVEESRQVIDDILSKQESYAICLKETGQVIGSISLKPAAKEIDIAGEGDLSVGYWLGSAYWGRGLASEALAAVIDHAFWELGADVLWAGYFEGNDRSRRCLEKCGFRCVERRAGYERPLLGDACTAYFCRLRAGDR